MHVLAFQMGGLRTWAGLWFQKLNLTFLLYNLSPKLVLKTGGIFISRKPARTALLVQVHCVIQSSPVREPFRQICLNALILDSQAFLSTAAQASLGSKPIMR